MSGKSTLRNVDDVLLGPVDRMAGDVTQRGPKWCEPTSAQLPRIMQLLELAKPTPEERAAFAKAAQRKRLTRHERVLERQLARRINEVSGTNALSTDMRQPKKSAARSKR